jgi:hypothetical protein
MGGVILISWNGKDKKGENYFGVRRV